MEQVFKISDLKYKKESKKKQDFTFQIDKHDDQKERKEKEDENKKEKEDENKKEKNKEEALEREEDIDIDNEPVQIIFKDARKTSLVDRELILKRLKRPIEIHTIELATTPTPVFLSDTQQDNELVEELKDAIVDDKMESILREDEEKDMDNLMEEDLPIIEIEQEPEKEVVKKVRKPRAKKGEKIDERGIEPPFDLTIEKVGKLTAAERLPTKQKLVMNVSSYYMNNRKMYTSQLGRLFKQYSDKIASKSAELSCKTLQTQNVDFDLLTHQLVIRDYLNLYTPYRGLLIYHGLGSGKTCTSIGVAEGMKSGKNIVLMTPASLKMNFFNELKKCGDVLYKKNQFWEFVSIEGDTRMIRILSQSLGLDPEYIRERGGAWMVNIKKKANFSELSDADQKRVDQQLDAMIRNKYTDINYNGLRQKHLDEMTNDGKINPFDNKVVIIDEAHNLVSRIANTGAKKNTIAYRLYHDLMDATNAKIIFLSGTPIINTPREIGILFNMLRGYIKTWTFTLQTTTTEKINREILMDYFRDDGLITYDYIDYSSGKLVVTRNPFGFVNVYKREEKKKRKGGKISKGSQKKRTTKENQRRTKKVNAPPMIDNLDVQDADELRTVEHMYRGLQRDYYEGGVNEGLSGGVGAYDDYNGVKLDEMGNISDRDFEKRLVRILADHGINVVGKPIVKKETCLPDTAELFNEYFINNEKGELMQAGLFKRRILGLTSYFRSAQEQLLPSFVKDAEGANYHIVNVDMSDHQFEYYETVRKEERDEEMRNKKKAKKGKGEEIDEKPTSTYRIYSRAACNFAFPSEHPRPILTASKMNFDTFNAVTTDMKQSQDDFFEEDEKKEEEADVENIIDYQKRIDETYSFLAYDSARRRPKEYLTEKELGTYSPKYLEILKNILDKENRGLHLLYSQFRTLEGIGIFKLILESNGFVEFKLVKKGREWEIENWDVDPEKPRFVLYTGTETAEEKDIVRNIYNGAWDIVPPSIVETLRKRHPNNLYGEIIKVLMITASGAEGINLRNTRFVHIMEPYWNMVRVDQVVGRARRICSHEDLPEDMRNVKVMIYLCRATKAQIDKNIELRTKDLSKLAYAVSIGGKEKTERVPFTTDQYLFEIAQIKDSITRQILTSVKETAIDCSLYNSSSEEPLVCYGFGEVEPQSFASYPTLERDAQEKDVEKKTAVKLGALTVDGVKYAINKQTMVVYDYASYLNAKEKRGQLMPIGIFDMRTKTILFDKV